MPPLCRTPPGQSSGTRQVLLPQPGAWPRFRCPFVNVTTRQQRFGFTHLPGPHLAPHRCLFHIAHHDGLQPTQHVVVWSLPPKGDSEGPSFISRTAPTPGRSWRVARPHCCDRAPSEPCVRVVPAHGSSKPREDPLPQTLYVALDLRPVNRPPLQGFALGSVRPRRSRGVQRVPWFPRRCHRALHRLTRPTWAPFRAGTPGPVSGQCPRGHRQKERP